MAAMGMGNNMGMVSFYCSVGVLVLPQPVILILLFVLFNKQNTDGEQYAQSWL